MMDLKDRNCISLDQDSAAFNKEKIDVFKQQLSPTWEVLNSSTLKGEFPFENFKKGMKFASEISVIAEKEQHHPDICIHYDKVVVELSTHSIGGLSLNDFIIAAKIDEL